MKQVNGAVMLMQEINGMLMLQKMCKCPFCNKDMSIPENQQFRDSLSVKEFSISGLCQECQDKTFGVEE